MGILDDAIREHLELKRQHGVSEEELRRQEEEALGPARREVVPAGDGEPGDDVAAEAAAEADSAAQETRLYEPDDEAPGDSAGDPAEFETALYEPPDRSGGEVLEEDYSARETGVTDEPDLDEDDAQVEDPFAPADETDEPRPVDQAPAADDTRLADDPGPAEEAAAGHGDEAAGGAEPDSAPAAPFDRHDDHASTAEDEEDFPFAEEDEPDQPPPPEGDPDVLEDTPDFLQETPEHDRLWFEQKPPRDFDFD